VERAIGIGYESVKFAESLLAEEENEYDCESYDLLRAAHLPKPDRTRAEVKMGVSEASQVERNGSKCNDIVGNPCTSSNLRTRGS